MANRREEQRKTRGHLKWIKMGVSINGGRFRMENPINMDDLQRVPEL